QREKNLKGDPISVATVNKDLRYVKAALRVAHEWEYLPKLPRFRFLKELGKLPTYVTPESFGEIYRACEHATLPNDLRNVAPAAWWRGLVVLGFMTGWRIGQCLELRWKDVDLAENCIITRAEHNKGKRDARIPVHPVVAEH